MVTVVWGQAGQDIQCPYEQALAGVTPILSGLYMSSQVHASLHAALADCTQADMMHLLAHMQACYQSGCHHNPQPCDVGDANSLQTGCKHAVQRKHSTLLLILPKVLGVV